MDKKIKLFGSRIFEMLTGDGGVLRKHMEVIYGSEADEAVRRYRSRKIKLYLAAALMMITLCVICLIASSEEGGSVEKLTRGEAGRGGINISLRADAEYGGAVCGYESSVKRFAARRGSEYKENGMFNIFSENKYTLYSSAVNEASVLWQRQAEEDLNNDR